MADYCGSLVDFADFADLLRDRQNPIEAHNDAEFLSRYSFSKRVVLRLLEMLPLGPNDSERGYPVPPMHADDMREIYLRVLRDRQDPIEAYIDAEFLSRYRFSKRAVLRLVGNAAAGPK
ncbi:hypothetical protein HPB52_021056 [Rhipicephalus sanguineus]|uniref:Uncharacterized protein n=1 Tax=Rhipicephalus sanguineus TaxID=34632 RepID=A0A9D4QBN9_RHISA|nr:hypothetical protein HPB52_021056 [Rhipicephalus sanguineus]